MFTLNKLIAHDAAVDAFVDRAMGSLGVIAGRLVTEIRQRAPDANEGMHDGMAVFAIQNAPFAYVAVHQAHVSLGLFDGVDLPDPARVIEGEGKRMRHVKLKPGKEPDEAAISALIEAAIALKRQALIAD